MFIFTTTRIYVLDKEKGEWTIYAKRNERTGNRASTDKDRPTTEDNQQIGNNDLFDTFVNSWKLYYWDDKRGTKVTLGENMNIEKYIELAKIHDQYRTSVMEGELHKNLIAGTVMIPTSKYWTVDRPPQWDCHRFFFHTRYEDYNDPMPVLREINTMIAKLEQLKISFVEAWKKEFAPKETKVTLAEEIEQMVKDADLEMERRKKFASIARPLFEEIWKENVRGPKNLLKAFGVCAEHYEELKHASGEGDCNYGEYKAGKDVEFTMYYKGIPIVEHHDARFDKVVPIYAYGRLVTRKLR